MDHELDLGLRQGNARELAAMRMLGKLRSLSLGAFAVVTGATPYENSNARTVPAWATLTLAATWTPARESGWQARFLVGNAKGSRYWISTGNGLVSTGGTRFYQVQVRKNFR